MITQLDEYKKAAAMMPGSVIIFQLEQDETMKVFFYSENAQELTGMEQVEDDQTVFSDGFNMIIEDDQKIIIEKVKSAIEHQEELDIIYRQHHKVHGVIWVHMKAVIVGEIDQRPVFLATMLDVTHEMLNSSSIMEASDRSICVIEKNTKLLLYGNSNFYELIRQKPSESMGVYCYDALCGNQAFKRDNNCLCFSTINIEKPFEYYNPETNQYLSMYGREILWGEHEAYVFFLRDQTQEKFREKQLKNAQERFEMTLDNSGLFIWEYDIVNNQCINSRKAVRDYGIPLVIDNYPESLYDMGHTPLETVEQIKDVKRRLLSGETGFSVERRTLDKDGNSQWMKVSYSLETDINGNPLRALVCGTDITEQKKKEFEYEEEIRLKKMVASNTKVLAILNLTKDKVAENDTHNPQLEKYLALGHVNDIMNAVCSGFIVPSDWENYRKHFNREEMLSNFERGVMHGSLRHQFIQMAGWYESAYDLIQNPSTGDVEAIISIKNVTDEVRSRQVVNRLTSIDYDMIITVDVGCGEVYKFDRGGDGEAGTGEKMTLGEYEVYLRGQLLKYGSPEEVQSMLDKTGTSSIICKLENAPIYTFMYTLHMDGKTTRKRNIYTYLDASKKTILCARQDVTETYLQEEKQKNELFEALRKAEIANQAKTAFLSRVSHDMRTPLNGILGLTTLLKDNIVDDNVMHDLMEMEISGKYLLNLINDTLDMSRIESGKLELHPIVSEGKSFFNNAMNLAKTSIESKHIHYHIHAENLPFTILYDDIARMEQVILNVVSNAVKFTPEGGDIDITVKNISVEDGVITDQIIIQDTGIGMSPEFLPHLFDAFSQEDGSSTSTSQGTGLGDVDLQAAAAAHGWRYLCHKREG